MREILRSFYLTPKGVRPPCFAKPFTQPLGDGRPISLDLLGFGHTDALLLMWFSGSTEYGNVVFSGQFQKLLRRMQPKLVGWAYDMRERPILRAWLALLSASLIYSSTPSLLAQTDEQRAAARALATEGATAFNDGRWNEAVDLFTRAQALVQAPPHLLFLARAHEKQGYLVRAREAYLRITKETLPANAPQAFRDAKSAAERELRQIEPRIASLTVKIEAPDSVSDLKVLIDKALMPSVLVGVARPIDPGEHRVEVLATGYSAAHEIVRLGEGERKSIVLRLVADPAQVAALAPAKPTSGAEAPVQGPPPPLTATPAAEQEPGSALRIGAYAAFGVGALGLGLGTYFLLDSRGKRADADAAFDACQQAHGDCRSNDPQARRTSQLDDEARSSLTLSVVALSVGGVGLAAGTALLLASASGKEQRHATGLSMRPFVGLGTAGFSGSF